ncbi:MAG TPA: PLDc N-terminal domain-containing protein [Actinoplanes sp.]|nr:PLDc N-terminal domain-containing protein [Actinoplanes sp.]
MSDLATTLTGIAFWTTLLAAYVTLFVATIAGIARARLDRRSRTRWIWLVVLAPGIGIIVWFAAGRVSFRRHS